MHRTLFVLAILPAVLIFGTWAAFAQQDPNCPGAPLPRLSSGTQARVLPGDANNVRDAASRSGTRIGSIPGGEVFEVIDGPVCADSLNWWQIAYGALAGWTVEGSGAEYWVEPYEADVPAAQPTVRPTAAPIPVPVISFEPPVTAINQPETGVRVRVVNDDPDSPTISLTMRANPGRSGAPAGQVQEGDLLDIIGGPEEVDGLRWWQVETARGATGWVIEGLANPDRRNQYERTLLALCPEEGERVAFHVDGYIVTSRPDGSAACLLDRLTFPGWKYFSATGHVIENTLQMSPDGEYWLYAEQLRQNDPHPYSRLYRLKRDGSERILVSGSIDVNWAHWSPDSTRIALASGRQIGIQNADGSSFISLTEGSLERSWVSWLPDGQSVVYAEDFRREDQQGSFIEYQRVFYRVDIREWRPQEIFRTPLRTDNRAGLSPDGTLLAVTGRRATEEAGLWVIDVETGTLVFEREMQPDEFLWMPDNSGLVFFSSSEILEIVPINGDEVYSVALKGDTLPPHSRRLLYWETATTALLGVGGFGVDSTQAGIWAVDLAAGEVRHRPFS